MTSESKPGGQVSSGPMSAEDAAQRDELLQVAIDFIGTLTGMKPPPIEVAPPEVFAPFRAFVDRVQAVTQRSRAVAVPDEDLQDLVSKALRKAWQLGQTYWQQADSEYISQQNKSDATQAKFQALVDETRAALAKHKEV